MGVREAREAAYQHSRDLIRALYEDYDWEYGMLAFATNSPPSKERMAALFRKIDKKITPLTKAYLKKTGQVRALEDLTSAETDAGRRNVCLSVGADALLTAREAYGRVVEVQFGMVDRFLCASVLTARASTLCEVFDKLLPVSFNFPGEGFDTQMLALRRSAQKATDAFGADDVLRNHKYAQVFNHFNKTARFVNGWKKSHTHAMSAEESDEAEKRVWQWNLTRFAMTLYVLNNAETLTPEDKGLKDTFKSLFEWKEHKDGMLMMGETIEQMRRATQIVSEQPHKFMGEKVLAELVRLELDRNSTLKAAETHVRQTRLKAGGKADKMTEDEAKSPRRRPS